MKELYTKLEKYSLEDAVDFEKSDRQFLALKRLYKNKKFSNGMYLFLTVANALVCYQLSGKGEDYWEEFSTVLQDREFGDFSDIEIFFEAFLSTSRNNKRFVDVKLKRIKKLKKFYFNFTTEKVQSSDTRSLNLWRFYYKNMDKLAHDLAKVMNQGIDAKTIIFAVKMFSYSARNVFGYLEYFPETLLIPIDSRLEKLYKKYNPHQNKIIKTEIIEFYIDLSKKLNIPSLHLDGLLWINYNELIK